MYSPVRVRDLMPRVVVHPPVSLRDFVSLQVAFRILFSTGTYLFDLLSNIAVTVEYFKHSTQYPAYIWLFAAMIVVLVSSHTINVVIFMMKFRKEENPLKAAYFLPLIQFWRLVNLVWSTCSCKGLKDVTSDSMNTVFSIVGASMETGPLLTIQFIPVNFLYYADVKRTTIISIAASLLSASYNGGAAVLWTAKNAQNSWKQKMGIALAAGSFTLFALILRCLTYYRISEVFQYAWSPPTILCLSMLLIYWVLYLIILTPDKLQHSAFDFKKCIRAFAFSYMTLTIGPLYPMVDEARERNQLGESVFRFRLLCMAVGSLLPDVIVTCAVIAARGLTSTIYTIAALVATFLYIVSTLWYLAMDKWCGAQTRGLSDHENQVEVATRLSFSSKTRYTSENHLGSSIQKHIILAHCRSLP